MVVPCPQASTLQKMPVVGRSRALRLRRQNQVLNARVHRGDAPDEKLNWCPVAPSVFLPVCSTPPPVSLAHQPREQQHAANTREGRRVAPEGRESVGSVDARIVPPVEALPRLADVHGTRATDFGAIGSAVRGDKCNGSDAAGAPPRPDPLLAHEMTLRMVIGGQDLVRFPGLTAGYSQAEQA